jgi:hypothetical protein
VDHGGHERGERVGQRPLGVQGGDNHGNHGRDLKLLAVFRNR